MKYLVYASMMIEEGAGFLKMCKKCNSVYPLSEYRKQKANRDGLTTWCKRCLKEYHTERRRKQGIQVKNKNKAIEGFKIGSKCKKNIPISNFSRNKNRY